MQLGPVGHVTNARTQAAMLPFEHKLIQTIAAADLAAFIAARRVDSAGQDA
jgi:hypothetical protein